MDGCDACTSGTIAPGLQGFWVDLFEKGNESSVSWEVLQGKSQNISLRTSLELVSTVAQTRIYGCGEFLVDRASRLVGLGRKDLEDDFGNTVLL